MTSSGRPENNVMMERVGGWRGSDGSFTHVQRRERDERNEVIERGRVQQAAG